MKATISTRIKTSEERMWEELQKASSLVRVASPILKFKPKTGDAFPKKWAPGTEYRFRLWLFGVIPMGSHHIKIVKLDKEKRTLISNEHGGLARTWNHLIQFESIDEDAIQYMDKIEIQAGLLTFPIWLFAHFFYRHRQRKWKKLLEDA